MEALEAILKAISDNSVAGATGAAALAFLYKIWIILKRDRKEDDLDNAERSFREEIRQELKDLRGANEKLRKLNEDLMKEKRECEERIAAFQARLEWLEICFAHCKETHPPECPLLKHLGKEKFDKLSPCKEKF